MSSIEITAFEGGSSLGIDVRSDVIRVLQAAGRTDLAKVTHALEIPLPKGTLNEGIIRFPRQVAGLIRDRLLVNGVDAKACAFSLPAAYTVAAEFALPAMASDEILEAAKFRLKKSLPFRIEDAYIETVTLGPSGDSNVSVLAMATPKGIIDSRADMLAFAGLQPIAAETEAHSILRVIHRRASRLDSLERDSSLTVVEVGGQTTSMYVIRERKLQFMRTVRFGVDDIRAPLLTATGRESIDLSEVFSQSTTRLTEEGVLEFEFEGRHCQCLVRDELGRLSKEISRLLRYFKSMHPERSYRGLLDTMLACGEMCSTPGFLDYFAGELGFRAELLRPLYEVNMGVHAKARDFIHSNEAKFPVATGCLLLGIEEAEQTGGMDHGRRNQQQHAA
ncbi:MAG: hypothetical protein BGO01_02155 [Armatimonadetes bacterium 55-13]|nr:pilus assembly protein PilM [Armatimonadota bacterium]OJU65733.1 MAG: hypothetical protein BGO01_02155 [Armatimonadetes bacterium 55-13]